VLIGPGLDTTALEQELDKCLLTDEEMSQKYPAEEAAAEVCAVRPSVRPPSTLSPRASCRIGSGEQARARARARREAPTVRVGGGGGTSTVME
jgi:hypothetical protein